MLINEIKRNINKHDYKNVNLKGEWYNVCEHRYQDVTISMPAKTFILSMVRGCIETNGTRYQATTTSKYILN